MSLIYRDIIVSLLVGIGVFMIYPESTILALIMVIIGTLVIARSHKKRGISN